MNFPFPTFFSRGMHHLLSACLLVSVGATAGLAAPNTSGYLILKSGETLEFTGTPCATFHYRVDSGGDSEIPIIDLRSVKFGDDGEIATIELRDGRRITVSRHRYKPWFLKNRGNHFFSYKFIDPISRQEKSDSARIRAIEEVRLGDDAGRLRICPKCESVWPEGYLYCPKDATQNEWGEASQ